MRVFIYTGGKIYPDLLRETPASGDYVIAADSGYRNAWLCGVKPAVVIGDFDSLGETVEITGEIIKALPEKDDTDTHLAVEKALEKYPKEIVIVGGTGGRLDHALSTIGILEYLHQKQIQALITNGQNRLRYLNSSSCFLPGNEYKYFGIIALDQEVKGLSLRGCKYPVAGISLYRNKQFAVSNEVSADWAEISCEEGAALVIESQDL